MPFDLLTLLAVRLGLDALIALAFWALMRRYPGIGGPGWWAAAAVLSMVGSVGLWMRSESLDLFSISVANTALCASVAFSWLGLRSYLGLEKPLRWVVVGLLGLLAANVVLLEVWDSMGARQVVFAGATLAVALLALRDLKRHDPQRRVPELQALRWVMLIELAALAVLVLVALFVATGQRTLALHFLAPTFVYFFLITKLFRTVLFSALVSLRLRQEGDRARQSLQTREADSRALIENLSAGVMVFRPDQTLSGVNAVARRFLGWTEGGANPALPEPTSPGWVLLREDGQPMRRHEMPFERVLAGGQPVRDVVLGMPVGSTGEVHWALCNAYPENDAQGGLRHVVLTFVDISSLRQAQMHQKALERQLAQSQKMEALGTLAGGVAHDFNNILAAILGNADLARQDLAPDTAALGSLNEISTAARRGRELVRQIMAFSRQQPMVRRPVHIQQVLNESCSLLRAALPSQVELLQRCEPGLAPVLADATQLGQVLLNLGTNAVHALEGRAGRIEYRVEQLPAGDPQLPADVATACAASGLGAVRVQVEDNGCGMTQATLARIFEPFFTTKAVGSGTGLGLPVALGIVQALGGAIAVETAPGRGTTFSIFFPSVATEADGGSGVASGSVPGGTMDIQSVPAQGAAHLETRTMAETLPPGQSHILYLDDDETLVFLVRRLLERRGYKVTAFSDQRQVIDAVQKNPQGFDLLLTDYNMPGMSGLEVAKAVLALNPALPVAVASGYITEELQAQALAAGVREVVFKTDAVEAFCEVVARLVNSPAS